MLKFLPLWASLIIHAEPSEERALTWLVMPDCMGRSDALACIDAELEKFKPCGGTAEERLACIERKVLAQTEEIYLLKRKLEQRTTPHVSPLTSSR